MQSGKENLERGGNFSDLSPTSPSAILAVVGFGDGSTWDPRPLPRQEGWEGGGGKGKLRLSTGTSPSSPQSTDPDPCGFVGECVPGAPPRGWLLAQRPPRPGKPGVSESLRRGELLSFLSMSSDPYPRSSGQVHPSAPPPPGLFPRSLPPPSPGRDEGGENTRSQDSRTGHSPAPSCKEGLLVTP